MLREARSSYAASRSVDGMNGDAAAAGPGQGTEAVHHALERAVQVQGLGDEQAGPADAGVAVCRLRAPRFRFGLGFRLRALDLVRDCAPSVGLPAFRQCSIPARCRLTIYNLNNGEILA